LGIGAKFGRKGFDMFNTGDRVGWYNARNVYQEGEVIRGLHSRVMVLRDGDDWAMPVHRSLLVRGRAVREVESEVVR
jgi:hypothetical protein